MTTCFNTSLLFSCTATYVENTDKHPILQLGAERLMLKPIESQQMDQAGMGLFDRGY